MVSCQIFLLLWLWLLDTLLAAKALTFLSIHYDRASFGSILAILQYTFQFEGLSRPGCWAHLDMLEVGCAKGPNGQQDEGLSLAETRTHFAAWAIMSSPLFLSHDVTNESIMDQVWPIISNREIIAINQAWAGFSGGPYWKSQEKLQFLFTDVPVSICFRYWKSRNSIHFSKFQCNSFSSFSFS